MSKPKQGNSVTRQRILDEVANFVEDSWLASYPEEIFVPPTKKQFRDAKIALRAIGMSLDKFNADMGRNLSREIAKDIRGLGKRCPRR